MQAPAITPLIRGNYNGVLDPPERDAHCVCAHGSADRERFAVREVAAEESHPIARSAEPGEDWSWCFVDEVFLRVGHDAA